ncbi:MAG TPA: LamG domain-containing protein [Cellvibrio sp.]|nr:LamG domain-containing protein [Cellvibrio sp.]
MKTINLTGSSRRLISFSLLSLSIFLSACGSGSSAKNNPKPNTSGGTSSDDFTYKGQKPAANEDVLKFQNNLWINLAREDRCGGCHTASGQAPQFARGDDINLAYEAVISNGLITLAHPAQSRIVNKVSKGHNCWEKDALACGDIITTYIGNWAGNSATSTNTLELKAPPEKDVENSKNFPASNSGFASSVYPLLKQYCAQCHAENSLTRQQPYFASSDLAVAYDAAKTKIRLDKPSASRFVQRLRTDFHNCWSDCTANAQEMENKIIEFANAIPAIAVDPALVISKTVSLSDAFVLTSGGRVDTNLIAKYEFKSGKGTIAYDTSGVEPAANLNILGNVAWSSAWGIKIKDNGRAQATTSTSRKFYDLIRGSGEYSIEAWIIPDNVTQGTNDNNPARIVTYSASATERNFTLGQYEYNYSFLNRSDKSNGNGLRELHTADNDKRLQATLQHIVVTFDQTQGRRIYVNGEFTGDMDSDKGAVLKDWDPNYALALGNEVGGVTGLWQGSIRFLGIHKRAMSAADINANYKVGVGAKYLLLFNVSSLIEVPGSYVVFEVQQFDDYGYLFANPFFTNLEGKAIAADIPVKGIRIGVNGEEASTGQVFANLDSAFNSSKMIEGRQTLSTLGTVVELKGGPEFDQFFVTFDQIGSKTYSRVVPASPPTAIPTDIVDQPLLGLRHFAQINATLSALTGVPQTNASVVATYNKVQQQLPTLANLDGFLAAQQMGITQLTVAYCNALVGNSSAANTLRDNYFVGFNFAAPAATAFDTNGRNQIIEPLLKHLLAHEVGHTGAQTASKLSNQPDPAELRSELNGLIDVMTRCTNTNTCASDRTLTTVKAACAAAMGSAVMLLH